MAFPWPYGQMHGLSKQFVSVWGGMEYSSLLLRNNTLSVSFDLTLNPILAVKIICRRHVLVLSYWYTYKILNSPHNNGILSQEHNMFSPT